LGAYTALTARVAALIARQGTPAIWRQVTPGTLDPITEAMAGAVTTETTVRVVLLPPGRSRDFEPGALVRRNIMEAWIAADVALAPAVGDTLAVADRIWTAITITEYAPDGGAPIAWKAYLER